MKKISSELAPIAANYPAPILEVVVIKKRDKAWIMRRAGQKVW